MLKNLLLLGSVATLLISCQSYHEVIVRPPERVPEIVTTDVLKNYLNAHPKPSVVLRVPYSTKNVAEAEQKLNQDYDNAYNQIEKALMKAGFTVRDRGLLNSILSGGNENYEEIKKKVNTDLIIEVTRLDFAVDEKVGDFIETNTGKVLHSPDPDKYYADPQSSIFSFKIIVVDKGQLGEFSLLTASLQPIPTCSNRLLFYTGKTAPVERFSAARPTLIAIRRTGRPSIK